MNMAWGKEKVKASTNGVYIRWTGEEAESWAGHLSTGLEQSNDGDYTSKCKDDIYVTGCVCKERSNYEQ